MSKWLNKRTQAVSERLNKDTKRTEYDPELQELLNQTDATKNSISKLVKELPTFLHPNPAARAKAALGTSYAKMRKTASERRYPHSSGELSTVMMKNAEEFPPSSAFGTAMNHVGEAMQKICDAQHAMDDEVNQMVLGPMKETHDVKLKELTKQKKKMESRRLDFDYKKRKLESGKTNFTNDDMKQAEEKFEQSKEILTNSMIEFLDNDVEQVSQLQAFIQAYMSMAEQTMEALREAQEGLNEVMEDAADRPRREQRPKSVYQFINEDDDDDDDDDFDDVPADAGPCCRAIYDFEPENDEELGFAEGQTLRLLKRLDENWLEGELNGKTGIFPSTYVEIIHDL